MAWRDGVRYALRLAPAPAADGPDAVVTGTWIVTGGLGGLGLAVAEELARPAPTARALRPPGPVGRRLEVLARIGQLGSEVRIVAVDVTDAVAVEAVVTTPPPTARRSAGWCTPPAWSTTVCWRLTPERFAAVRGPKVDGAANLLSAADRHQPDHVVLFAAGAGLFGPAGQGATPPPTPRWTPWPTPAGRSGRPAQSIDWGPWSRSAWPPAWTAPPAAGRPRASAPSTRPKAGPPSGSLLAAPEPQVAVLKLRWPALLHHYTKHGIPPIMQDLVRAAQRRTLGEAARPRRSTWPRSWRPSRPSAATTTSPPARASRCWPSSGLDPVTRSARTRASPTSGWTR